MPAFRLRTNAWTTGLATAVLSLGDTHLDAGRTAVGDCRREEFANTAAKVKSSLDSLQTQYPEEDWAPSWASP